MVDKRGFHRGPLDWGRQGRRGEEWPAGATQGDARSCADPTGQARQWRRHGWRAAAFFAHQRPSHKSKRAMPEIRTTTTQQKNTNKNRDHRKRAIIRKRRQEHVSGLGRSPMKNKKKLKNNKKKHARCMQGKSWRTWTTLWVDGRRRVRWCKRRVLPRANTREALRMKGGQCTGASRDTTGGRYAMARRESCARVRARQEGGRRRPRDVDAALLTLRRPTRTARGHDGVAVVGRARIDLDAIATRCQVALWTATGQRRHSPPRAKNGAKGIFFARSVACRGASSHPPPPFAKCFSIFFSFFSSH